MPPFPLMGHVAHVTNGQGRALRQGKGHVRWMPDPHDEADAPIPQPVPDLAQTLEQEGVMPDIGGGIGRRQSEAHHHGNPHGVGVMDRHLQGRIVPGPLGLLHPVEHVIARPGRGIVPVVNAGGVDGVGHGIFLSMLGIPGWEAPRPFGTLECPLTASLAARLEHEKGAPEGTPFFTPG